MYHQYGHKHAQSHWSWWVRVPVICGTHVEDRLEDVPQEDGNRCKCNDASGAQRKDTAALHQVQAIRSESWRTCLHVQRFFARPWQNLQRDRQEGKGDFTSFHPRQDAECPTHHVKDLYRAHQTPLFLIHHPVLDRGHPISDYDRPRKRCQDWAALQSLSDGQQTLSQRVQR